MYPVDIIENLNALDVRLVVPSFSPADITGLQLWLDANDALTLFQDAAKTTSADDGDVIGAWADKSGNGNDVIQTTTAKKPTYQTGVLNGRAIVRIDGADDFLRVAALAGGPFSQPTSVFLVAKLSVVNAENQIIFGGTTVNTRQIVYKISTGNKWTLYAGAALSSAEVVDTAWHIIDAVFNGVSSTLAQDGTQIKAGNAGAFTQTGVTIGATQDGTGRWNGDVGEVIFYNNAVGTDNTALLREYLSTKWGIAIA